MESTNSVFAANLQKMRIRAGISQQKLADMLGYSEKAVSKWECGRSMPGALTLPAIARALNVSIDELFCARCDNRYFLGIDGGGTATRFILEDEKGGDVNSVVLSMSNPNDIGFDKTAQIIDKGIREVCGGIPFGCINAFAGVAGCGTEQNRKLLENVIKAYGFNRYNCDSDGPNAISASLDTDDGICVIIGTGCCAFYQSERKIYRIGGFGYLLDGAGSGYDIGAGGISAALKAEHGIGGDTALCRLICEKTGKSSVFDSLGDFYAGGKAAIASFAPLVFSAAAAGDEISKNIIEKNTEYIARLIQTCAAKMPERAQYTVRLCGGIAQHHDISQIVKKYLDGDKYDVGVTKRDNSQGAVLMARRLLND